MSFELTKEQRWEILDSLPESLKDVIFSGDTSEAISSICLLHEIDDTSTLAKLVGQVLMGLLPPDKIAETIKKRIPVIEESLCNTLAIEIQHYILDPIMDDLLTLYTEEKVQQLNNQEKGPAKTTDSRDLYREKVVE